MDEVFGSENCQNEVIWKRTSARSDSHTFNHIHGRIFLYTKSDKYTFHTQYTAYDQSYIDNFYRHVEDKTGRRYMLGRVDVDAWPEGG